MKDFRTVREPSEIEIVINKSRFIGRCYPVAEEREALEILERIRKQHWDATHNCYAYSIGESGQTARFSDDGEPSGTAGLPMMDAIRKNGVTNLVCIATRYFGGVLLGAGGLVRAYAKTAAESIRAAGRVDMRCCAAYEATVPYPLWGRVESILRTEALLENTAYAESIEVRLSVPLDLEAALLKQLSDRTDGRVLPVKAGIVQRAFDAGLPELKE